MARIIPWKELAEAIETYFSKPKCAGRRPIEVECILHFQFLQHWFNLSDLVAGDFGVRTRSVDFARLEIMLRYPNSTRCCQSYQWRRSEYGWYVGDGGFYTFNIPPCTGGAA